MDGDIYWTHAAFSALKSNNHKMFEYALGFITNKLRHEKLKTIQHNYKNNDESTMTIINNYKREVPIVVA